jgi:hypothetical protein
MRDQQRRRLVALLHRLAPDLAARAWRARDAYDLPAEVRGAMVDVLGFEAAGHGLRRDGTPNAYGDELDGLAEALAGAANRLLVT